VSPGANLEIGVGGDLGGELGLPKGAPFGRWLQALKAEVRSLDPLGTIDFIEGIGDAEQARIASAEGMPYRQFTDLYVVGGNREGRTEDAVATLTRNLATAATMGTIESLNMQVWGVGEEPSDEALCTFYHQAEPLARAQGITLFTETHVDRFTYDPRRLLRIHKRLLAESSGAYGLRVGADFSHYVHQLGNPTTPNWAAIRSGELILDPFNPANIVTTGIIDAGLVGYGHLRCAVPNDRARDHGSIQYPLRDPASDPHQPWRGELACGGTWDEARTRPWREFYRQVFAYQLAHPQRRVARFSSEFIGWNDHCDYRIEGYGNLHQNLAVVAWAQGLKRQLLGARTSAAIG